MLTSWCGCLSTSNGWQGCGRGGWRSGHISGFVWHQQQFPHPPPPSQNRTKQPSCPGALDTAFSGSLKDGETPQYQQSASTLHVRASANPVLPKAEPRAESIIPCSTMSLITIRRRRRRRWRRVAGRAKSIRRIQVCRCHARLSSHWTSVTTHTVTASSQAA